MYTEYSAVVKVKRWNWAGGSSDVAGNPCVPPKCSLIDQALTNSDGCGGEVEEPEEDEVPSQLQREEDN